MAVGAAIKNSYSNGRSAALAAILLLPALYLIYIQNFDIVCTELSEDASVPYVCYDVGFSFRPFFTTPKVWPKLYPCGREETSLVQEQATIAQLAPNQGLCTTKPVAQNLCSLWPSFDQQRLISDHWILWGQSDKRSWSQCVWDLLHMCLKGFPLQTFSVMACLLVFAANLPRSLWSGTVRFFLG